MAVTLNWGIIGTGYIAKTFAKGIAASKTGKLVAVGSRTQAGADKFGDEFSVARRHASYDALIADPDVQAVYIATPHPQHAELSIKLANAGKHVLCEKPMTLNHAEAMAVIEAALRNNVFFMEAFMYRLHPQTGKLIELIREKVIGEVRVIQATFSFRTAFNPESRLLSNALGGGGILDVGGYCTSLAGLIAGAATGEEFAEPIELKATGIIGPVTRVDEYAVAVLKYPGGILAQLSTGVQVNEENVVRIFGTDGHIFVPSPWVPSKEGGTTKIIVHKNGEKEPREVLVESPFKLYAIEADAVAAHLADRQVPSPGMTWNDSLSNMRTLDQWREAIGMLYDGEKSEALGKPVHKAKLMLRLPPLRESSTFANGSGVWAARGGQDNQMRYGSIGGVNKPISRLLMGVDNQRTIAHACVMFDDFIERGGNCFDTAWVYGGAGAMERVWGQWNRNRNIREQIVLVGKGAHTPECNPEALTRQLKGSLERLQTHYVDIYMLHRDNLQVPVGEFVDVLNEHKNAGRMRVFGGSNWSLERVDAANAYAKSKGLQGFSVVSNNFSLARMIEPPWSGCVSASDPASRSWFEKTQTTLLAWSSQARGFFTDRAGPELKSDAELVRCWYSDDNFKRRERVMEMAAKKNVMPINIALAYVLNQPFPTFALIGPRTLAETRTSLPGLDVELSADDVKWLNLEK